MTLSLKSFPTLNVVLFVLLLLVTTGCQPSESQPRDDDTLERERIVENLKYQIPQLRDAQSVQLGALQSTSVPGFQKATLTINGANQVPLLIRDDGEQVLVLAADPVDVSLTADEVQTAMAEASKEKRERFASLVSEMPVRGKADAPVTLAVFSDFECPYCARSISLIDALRDRYPDRMNFVFLHFPLSMHPWAKPASIASQCAAQQDDAAFWTLHDLYFEKQDALSTSNVVSMSTDALSEADLDLEEWRTCATDTNAASHQQARQTVETHMAAGEEMGVRGTPTFLLNGEVVRGARSVEAFGQRIEAEAASN